MRNVAKFPDYHHGAWDRWGPRPVEDIDKLFERLSFAPERATLLLPGNYYPAAKLLGMEVPRWLTEGEVEIEPGVNPAFQWGSIDGRSTDYLNLDLDCNRGVLHRLLERLSQVMTIDRRSDLQVFLHAPAS